MKAVVCLDDRGGMTFNKRRQSRDRVLIDDLVGMADGSRLYITQFSEPLFSEHLGKYTVAENMIDIAEEGDYCFVEDLPLADAAQRIDTLVIYRWNRHYPSSTYLDIAPESLGMKLVSSTEFVGSSHEKITKEIYTR